MLGKKKLFNLIELIVQALLPIPNSFPVSVTLYNFFSVIKY